MMKFLASLLTCITLFSSPLFAVSTDTCYDTDTVLMLQMEDTSLSDSSASAHTITLNGNVARSSTQAKFGTYSAVFDGTTDYLSVASHANFGMTGDFTEDFWLYFNSVTQVGLTYIGASDTNYVVKIHSTGGGRLDFTIGGNANGTPSYTFNTGQWYHIALTKSSGTCRIYVDGVSQDSWACGSVTQGALVIGAYYDGSIFSLNGYIDNVRIVKGTAVWAGASSFTPPSSAYTACAVAKRRILTTVG